MATQTDILRTIIDCKGAETAAKQFGMLGKAAGETDAKLRAAADRAGQISMLAGGIGTGMLAAAGGLIKVAGAAEQAQIAFTTLLKSPQDAKRHLSELAEFSASTPFEFTGLRTLSTQLLAFGFTARDVIPMLTSLGDAGSALGKGPEGLERMIRAIGQIQAKGRVQMQELLQLAEAGVPVFQILQDELGLTAAQVGEIGSQGVSAKDGIAALLRGMDKLYGGGMAQQSESLFGVLSNLSDQFQLLGIEIGETLLPYAKATAETVVKLTEALRDASPATKAAVGAILLFGGVGMVLMGVAAKVTQLVLLWKLAAAQKKIASQQAIQAENAEAAAVDRTTLAYTRKARGSSSSLIAHGRLGGRLGTAQALVGWGMSMTRLAQAADQELDAADKMSKVAASAGYLAGAFNPLILAATGLGEVIGYVIDQYYSAKAARTAERTGNAPGIINGDMVTDPKRLAQQMQEPEYAAMSATQFFRAAERNWANRRRREAFAAASLKAEGASADAGADVRTAQARTAYARAYETLTGKSEMLRDALAQEARAHNLNAYALRGKAQYETDEVKRKELLASAVHASTQAMERQADIRRMDTDAVKANQRAEEEAARQSQEQAKAAIDAKREAVEAYTKAIQDQTNALNETLSIGNAYAQYLDTIGRKAEADQYRKGALAQQAASVAQWHFRIGDPLGGWQAATQAEQLARTGMGGSDSLGFGGGGAQGALTGAVPGYIAQAAQRQTQPIQVHIDNTVRDEAGTIRARMRREDRHRYYAIGAH